MSQSSNAVSKHAFFYTVAVLMTAFAVIWFTVGSGEVNAGSAASDDLGASFPGMGTGAIPDGGPGCGPLGTPIDITFNVSGLSGAPSNVNVDFTATHSWVGDLNASVISPDGTEHILFAHTGSTVPNGCGSANDLAGMYAFDNSGAANWWALGNPFPAGTYQTTTAGDAPTGGTPTDMNAAFAGIPTANGTWTLRVVDGGGGDTGTVTAANITLTTMTASGARPNFDADGDGTTDFGVGRDISVPGVAGSIEAYRHKSGRERIRSMLSSKDNGGTNNVTGGAGVNIGWYVKNSSDNSLSQATFGEPATDFLTPADFDGDGRDDLAVWRSGAQSTFYILQSSDSTVVTDDFGQTFDNPGVVGDYDGDQIADPAVFRCPDAVDGTCFFYFRGSNGNPGGNITFVPWGFGTFNNTFPAAGDYDGDGKFDFNVQQTAPGGPVTGGSNPGIFYLLRSSDFGVEYIPWGLDNDFIVPGDYDGDGSYDIAVARNNNAGAYEWYILERDGGTSGGVWGNPATDFLVPGDYDGDGSSDLAVFRIGDPAADATCADGPGGCSQFWYYSQGAGSFSSYQWGRNTDYPIAAYRVQ